MLGPATVFADVMLVNSGCVGPSSRDELPAKDNYGEKNRDEEMLSATRPVMD